MTCSGLKFTFTFTVGLFNVVSETLCRSVFVATLRDISMNRDRVCIFTVTVCSLSINAH
jgi:hypothetical protein